MAGLVDQANMTANWSMDRVNTTINLVMPLDIILYGSFFYTIIFLIGTLGNLSVIVVLLREKELRSFTNYLLANMSIADLLVLFTCVPTAFHDLYAKERWYLGQVMCYLIGVVEQCVGIASILSLLLITCERYYAICKPLKVRSVLTHSRTLRLIAFIWLVSIALSWPVALETDYGLAYFYDKNTDEYQCTMSQGSSDLTKAYFIVISFVVYLAIGVVLLVMYYKMSRYLTQSTKILISMNKTFKSKDMDSKAKKSLLKKSEIEKREKLRTVEGCPSSGEETPPSTFQNKPSPKCHHRILNFSRSNLRRENMVNGSASLPVNTKKLFGSTYTLYQAQQQQQRRGSNTTASATTTTNNSTCIPSVNTLNINSNLDRYVRPRQQLIFMLMCVVIIFYVCVFPIKIWWILVTMYGHSDYMRNLQLREYWYISITMRILFYTNSSINPILYNCLSKKFRQSFLKMLDGCPVVFNASRKQCPVDPGSQVNQNHTETGNHFAEVTVMAFVVTDMSGKESRLSSNQFTRCSSSMDSRNGDNSLRGSFRSHIELTRV